MDGCFSRLIDTEVSSTKVYPGLDRVAWTGTSVCRAALYVLYRCSPPPFSLLIERSKRPIGGIRSCESGSQQRPPIYRYNEAAEDPVTESTRLFCGAVT